VFELPSTVHDSTRVIALVRGSPFDSVRPPQTHCPCLGVNGSQVQILSARRFSLFVPFLQVGEGSNKCVSGVRRSVLAKSARGCCAEVREFRWVMQGGFIGWRVGGRLAGCGCGG
jgi:hypothetical protein